MTRKYYKKYHKMSIKSNFDLDDLQGKLQKERPKKRKIKVRGTGFAKQREIMEQSDFYSKLKTKKSIKITYKGKNKK